MAGQEVPERYSQEWLEELNFQMVNDAARLCVIVRDASEFIKLNLNHISSDSYSDIARILEDYLREVQQDFNGLRKGAYVNFSGNGAYWFSENKSKPYEGRILGKEEKVFGQVYDVCVRRIPIFPGLLAEGPGDIQYDSVLSPCLMLRTSASYNKKRRPTREGKPNHSIAIVPLEYEGIEFAAVI